MKKLITTMAMAAVMLIAGTGCGKKDTTTNCTAVDPTTEDARLQAYAAAQGITATKQPSTGIYYQIINAGTGVIPTVNSRVSVQYTGKTLDGTTFDSNQTPNGYTEYLSNLIAGWQYGVPLIRVGGTIKLIIPSAYAYGCRAAGSIPANSPLYFEIKLVAVN